MLAFNLLGTAVFFVAAVVAQDLLTDISQIQRYWGQISTYADNAEDYFGIDYVGLPNGCQIVSPSFQIVRANS
jgi:hypothetical protein